MRKAFLILITVVSVCTHAAAADIHVFTDDKGVMHLTDIPQDTRYRPVTVMTEAQSKIAPAKPDQLRGKLPLLQLVEHSSAQHGVDAALVHAVIRAESNFNVRAVSPKGAQGLMQLMPATALRYGVSDTFDPVQNIEAGVRHLAMLLKLFQNDVRLALAAYNAGEKAVITHGYGIPPFRETLQYVPRVLGYYDRYRETIRVKQDRSINE